MQANFYKASGKFQPIFFVYYVLALIIAMPILAVVYSYLIRYVPIVYLNVLTAIFGGAGVGLAVGYAAKLGKARNPMLVSALAMFAVIVFKYIQWAVYLPIIFTDWPILDRFVESAWLLIEPGVIWDGIRVLNEFGAWTLSEGSGTINGWMLSIVWAIEMLLIFGGAVVIAHTFASTPFSEEQGGWYQQMDTKVHTDRPDNVAVLKEQLNQGNLTGLKELTAKGQENLEEFLTLSFMQAPEESFTEPYYLTVSERKVEGKRKRSGKRKKGNSNTNNLVTHLAIDRQTLNELKAAPTVAQVTYSYDETQTGDKTEETTE